MSKGEYAVYNITATGFVKKALKEAEIPESYIRQTGDMFQVPRLCTFWRGDAEEAHWQDELRTSLLKADDKAEITITAEPWEMLPGYPQGAL